MMATTLLLVFLKGILVQGWLALLFRRHSKRAWFWVLLALDALWGFWVLYRMRGGSIVTWRQPALFFWLLTHLTFGAVATVETLARMLPWPRFIRVVGGSLVLMAVGFSAWGLAEAYGPPRREEVQLSFPDLPQAFDGYRILLISDVHAGPYAGSRTLRQWGRAMADMDADLLVGAGDFISYWPQETEALREPFAAIHPRDGRVGVLGNHDRYRTSMEVAGRLENQGWRILTDESIAIERGGERLLLMGIGHPEDEDPDHFKPPWHPVPTGPGFRIGIVHTPMLWPQLRQVGARLSLAGHTHGGQINLDPLVNVARVNVGYVAGIYENGPDRLFVTKGLGCTALPFRIRCRPEIVRITLRRG